MAPLPSGFGNEKVSWFAPAGPDAFVAGERPAGTRGAFLWSRTGSKVANSAASRLLNVPTTA